MMPTTFSKQILHVSLEAACSYVSLLCRHSWHKPSTRDRMVVVNAQVTFHLLVKYIWTLERCGCYITNTTSYDLLIQKLIKR